MTTPDADPTPSSSPPSPLNLSPPGTAGSDGAAVPPLPTAEERGDTTEALSTPSATAPATRDAEVAALQSRLSETEARLTAATSAHLAAAVLEACARSGVRDLNRADVIRAARDAFAVAPDLSIRPQDPAGAASLDAWLEDHRRAGTAAWWDVPAGAGTPPSRSAASLSNPFSAEGFNLTEQGRLLRDHPDLARRLRDQAR